MRLMFIGALFTHLEEESTWNKKNYSFEVLAGKSAQQKQVPNFLAIIGDREPHTMPTKDLSHDVVFLGGWCANCRNLRTIQSTHHPQYCTRDVHRRFCGGGVWISRSEINSRLTGN